MGGIFGGGSSGKQTVSTTNNIPEWANQGGQAIFNAGSGLASRPYPLNPNPRVAPLNADQQKAFDLVRDSSGSWNPAWQTASDTTGAGADLVKSGAGYVAGANPMIDQAGDYISQGAGKVGAAQAYTDAAGRPVGQSDIEAYMNPYTDDVINSVMKSMNQQFGRQKIDQTAALTARGSRLNEDRRGVIEGINDQNFDQTMAQAIANLKMNGFNNALTQANTTKSQALAAGGQTGALAQALASMGGQTGALANLRAALGTSMGGLGGELGQIGGQQASLAALLPQLQGIDIGNLLSTGQIQQGQTQANYNVANQDFLNQFNFPQEQLDWLNGILRGTPYSTSSTQTSPVGQTNPWAQALGLVGTGVGAAGSAGVFG